MTTVEIVSADCCATEVEVHPSVTAQNKQVFRIILSNLWNFISGLKFFLKHFYTLLTYLFKYTIQNLFLWQVKDQVLRILETF